MLRASSRDDTRTGIPDLEPRTISKHRRPFPNWRDMLGAKHLPLSRRLDGPGFIPHPWSKVRHAPRRDAKQGSEVKGKGKRGNPAGVGEKRSRGSQPPHRVALLFFPAFRRVIPSLTRAGRKEKADALRFSGKRKILRETKVFPGNERLLRKQESP